MDHGSSPEHRTGSRRGPGHVFPKAAPIKAGYNPDTYFSRVIFSGEHHASAIADAPLDVAYSRGMLKQDELAVIWTSDPVPGGLVAYRRDPPAMRRMTSDAKPPRCSTRISRN